MLPAPYQVPVAIVLTLGGALACFFGYRLFRLVLAVYGFILGALVVSSVLGPAERSTLLMGLLGGGLAGALVMIAGYFVGVALIGAAVGALAANLIWRQTGSDPGAIVVIVFAVLGAFGALVLQRYVVILATAFSGAWTLLVGGLALVQDRAVTTTSLRETVLVVYPLNAAPDQRWIIPAWLVLGTIGTLVQLGVTGRRKR